jgi:hypothetical protein
MNVCENQRKLTSREENVVGFVGMESDALSHLQSTEEFGALHVHTFEVRT